MQVGLIADIEIGIIVGLSPVEDSTICPIMWSDLKKQVVGIERTA